jgi:hypothetical protein
MCDPFLLFVLPSFIIIHVLATCVIPVVFIYPHFASISQVNNPYMYFETRKSFKSLSEYQQNFLQHVTNIVVFQEFHSGRTPCYYIVTVVYQI